MDSKDPKQVTFNDMNNTVITMETPIENTVKKEKKEDIDLNDFEVPTESQDTSFFVALNVFHLYYKMRFNCDNTETMFHGINPNDITATNKSSELFYDSVCVYNNNTKLGDEYIKLYDPDKIDDTKFSDIYALTIDGEITNLSPSLFTLILHLTNLKWHSIEWKILKIKGEE